MHNRMNKILLGVSFIIVGLFTTVSMADEFDDFENYSEVRDTENIEFEEMLSESEASMEAKEETKEQLGKEREEYDRQKDIEARVVEEAARLQEDALAEREDIDQQLDQLRKDRQKTDDNIKNAKLRIASTNKKIREKRRELEAAKEYMAKRHHEQDRLEKKLDLLAERIHKMDRSLASAQRAKGQTDRRLKNTSQQYNKAKRTYKKQMQKAASI